MPVRGDGAEGEKRGRTGTQRASVLRLGNAGTWPLPPGPRGAATPPRLLTSVGWEAGTGRISTWVRRLVALLLFDFEGHHAFCVKRR